MLTVLATGPLATVQDLGRPGHAGLGVSRSGAADRASLRLANRLVGNAEDAAAIEVTFGGLELRVEVPAIVALAGAQGPAQVDGRAAAHGEPVRVPAGAVVRLGAPVTGLRTYLAVRGGVGVEPVLGSRSTDTLAGLGPLLLSDGARLPIGAQTTADPAREAVEAQLRPDTVAVRVVLGPRDDWFTPTAIRRLLGTPWRVTNRADRVGMRLAGAGLERSRLDELPSEGCVRGSVQVSADGSPTVFGPDHPVTGGYPVIAVVVDADCDRLGQCGPGDRIRFERADRRGGQLLAYDTESSPDDFA